MTKRKGAIIPDPIDTPGTRKVVVCIPDTVEWLSLFTGLVSQLRYGWYWDRSTGDLDAIRDRAQRVYFEMQDQNGDCMTLNCDEVANCIETSDAVKNALYALVQSQIENAQGFPLSATTKSTPLNQNYETCDKDSLWGSCLNTIQTINRLNMDFLETVEAATNNQEAVDLLISAIPILETLPIDEALEFVNKIREFVQEFYLAGYDLDLETEFACELFCEAVANDCKLDMNVITAYFWARAEALVGWENAFLSSLALLSAAANWQEQTGEEVVICMYALNMGFLNFLNSALGMDFGHFKLKARSGIPDDDWMTCPCADAWVHTFDFTIDDQGFVDWTVGGTFGGDYVAGVGWDTIDNTSTGKNNRTISIKRDVPVMGNFTKIQVYGNFTLGAYDTPSEGAYSLNTVDPVTNYQFIASTGMPSGTDILIAEWTGDVDTDLAWAFFIRPSRNTGAVSGSALATRIVFRGNGDDPFA